MSALRLAAPFRVGARRRAHFQFVSPLLKGACGYWFAHQCGSVLGDFYLVAF
jgi:hypothetical protein